MRYARLATWLNQKLNRAQLTTAPGFTGYSGATISRTRDGSGAEYVGCCARRQADGLFGFFVFRNGAEALYSACDGRGSIDIDPLDSLVHWIAWSGSAEQAGIVPGCVPIAQSGGYTACIPLL